MVALIASILLAFICAWYLLTPHFCEQDGVLEAIADDRAILDRKERTVQLLKDLDLDFSTGKLASAEYDRMRISLTSELGSILTQIDGTKSDK